MIARILSIAALTLAGCARPTPPEPAAEPPPADVAPAEEESPMSALHGRWTYADDPTGAIPSEPIYKGSAITFGADGKYAFQLGETTFALEGTWALTGQDGDTLRVHTEYGQGRRNDLTLTLRRTPTGEVAGMEVREGDGSTGARFYVPAP